jgi:hypothetical protein
MRPLQTSPELEDDSRYSQVSPAAVVALLLGLASPLAFIGPLFFLVPAAAVGMGLLALSKIGRGGGALSGSTLARIAMALGLGCIAAALVRDSVRDSLVQRQAVEAAQTWVGLLADGRIEDAAQMLSGDGGSMLLPQPEPGSPPMAEEDAKELMLTNLSSQVLARAWAGQDDPGVVESVSAPVYDGPKTIVQVNLGVDDPQAGGHRHVQLQLVRARYYEALGKPWRIDRWETGEAHGAH